LARRRTDKKPQRPKSSFETARDELFRVIRECGVIDAHEEDKGPWMEETVAFMAERYPDLSAAELGALRDLGLRFCQPVIPHGKEHAPRSNEEANAA
jgi:hypothetical protein